MFPCPTMAGASCQMSTSISNSTFRWAR
jgi:hypothetical protein